MLLNEPGRTSYDINFNLVGFPVRVHPAFFIMPLILGGGFLRNSPINAGLMLIVLVAVFFVSILVHELGHALAFRYFGQGSRIVLYWMGGLAIPDGYGGGWTNRSDGSRAIPQIIISVAGPVFGFLLAALLIGIVIAMGGSVEFEMDGIMPTVLSFLPREYADTSMGFALVIFFQLGIWVNIFLNILNLVPVFPLDGGQIARQVFLMNDPGNGMRYSIILSIAAGAIIALMGFQNGDQFIGFFFAIMAWSNYMSLQQIGGGYGGGRPW